MHKSDAVVIFRVILGESGLSDLKAKVVILGAGHAGGSAAAYLRQYGHEGPIVIVGLTWRLRDVIWSPARDAFCCVDSRIAWTRSLSPEKVTFAPIPISVEIATPLSSAHVWKSTEEHAPLPLAASGLDMRNGHPAASMAGHSFSSKVLKPRRRFGDARAD